MPKLLRVREIDEISLVDRGANPEAHVEIYKRTEPPAPPGPVARFLSRIAKLAKAWDEAATFAEIQAERKDERDLDRAIGEASSWVWDLQDAITQTLRDRQEADKAGLIQTSIQEFAAAVEAALPSWTAGEPLQKAGRKISGARLKRLRQARDAITTLIDEVDPPPEGGTMPDTKKSDTPPTTTAPEGSAAPPATPADAGTGGAGVTKAAEIPEDVRKRLEAAEARAEAAEKRAQEAETLAKAERDAREIAKLEQQITADMASLPGVTAAEFAPVLKAARERLGADEFDKIESVLKAASEAIRQGALFGESGRASTAPAGSTAWGKIEAAAREAAQQSGGQLSFEAAVEKVMRENPALAREYADEIR